MDAVVIGGGVIGLSVAWQAAREGLEVAVVDPDPGSGASHFAAGMIAPVGEAEFGEDAVIAVNQDSAARYPAFVAELESDSAMPAGYRRCGSLHVAVDAGRACRPRAPVPASPGAGPPGRQAHVAGDPGARAAALAVDTERGARRRRPSGRSARDGRRRCWRPAPAAGSRSIAAAVRSSSKPAGSPVSGSTATGGSTRRGSSLPRGAGPAVSTVSRPPTSHACAPSRARSSGFAASRG